MTRSARPGSIRMATQVRVLLESTRSAPMLSTIWDRRGEPPLDCPSSTRNAALPAAPQSTPRLACRRRPGAPRCTASATLNRWLRIAASASSGRPRGPHRRSPCAPPATPPSGRGSGWCGTGSARSGSSERESAGAPFRAARSRAVSRAARRSHRTRRGGHRPPAARCAARGRPARGPPAVVDALGGLANREPFEHGARLQDLDRFLVRHLAHACSPVRLADHEPVLLEPDQRRPDRRATCRRWR